MAQGNITGFGKNISVSRKNVRGPGRNIIDSGENMKGSEKKTESAEH